MGEPPQPTTVSSQRCETGSCNPVPASWPASARNTVVDARAVALDVTASLNKALARQDSHGIVRLFDKDGFWRDHLALSWKLRTLKGWRKMQSFLQQWAGGITKVELDTSTEWRAPKLTNFAPETEAWGLQFYTALTLKDGTGRGVVRLIEKDDAWLIWTFFASRADIQGHEELVGLRRPRGVDHDTHPGRKNWKDRRDEEVAFVDRDPHVLIVGAGQGGLTAHARLKMLGVPTLTVDTNASIGDNWRKRYHQLVLHDPVWYDHLPYMPFPESWPVFTPKDKLADWLEAYAKMLELDVWTSTCIVDSKWDERGRQWAVALRRVHSDGREETRMLHPKHIVQATGHSGQKHFPEMPGQEMFSGDLLCHSSDFSGARNATGQGKKAVVVGACNSSHDICQDYFEKGYAVTMVQRSSTCVVSSHSVLHVLLKDVFEENGPSVEDGDLFLWSWPSEVFKAVQRGLTVLQAEKDRVLLDRLEQAGFKTDLGPHEAGLFAKYLQRGGGYYFDVGASQLIIDGKIQIKQGVEVAEVLANGLKMADGSVLEADEIVFATGYENMRTQTGLVFGSDVMNRVRDVWGWDEEGEMRSVWRDSGHPGFWFHGGNLALCRYYSKILALQIKARLEGLVE